MTPRKFKVEVEKARKRVRGMDCVDGFKDRYLSTILFALECGLKNPETGAQFDAYVMLEERRRNENPT